MQNIVFSPVEYKRHYFDEPEGTVELAGILPCIDCSIELLKSNAAHEMLLSLVNTAATGDEAAALLYAADISSGLSPCSCVKREYSVVPKSLRTTGSQAGLPAYTLDCSFKARGLPEPGRALISDDRQTLIYEPVI